MASELTLSEEIEVLRRLLAHICGVDPDDIKVEKLPIYHPYKIHHIVAYEYSVCIDDPAEPEQLVAMLHGMREHGVDVTILAEDNKVVIRIDLGPDYYYHWYKTVVEK